MNTILNLNSLVKKLDKLSDVAVKDALEESCLLVERDAKIFCPVDQGQLRASITHEVDGDTGAVGTNVEYAPYVHQGTGIYASDGNGRQTPWSYQDKDGNWHTTKGQAPNPFLDRALNKNRNEIKKIFKEKVKEASK